MKVSAIALSPPPLLPLLKILTCNYKDLLMQIYIWVVWVFAWIRHEGVKPEIYLNPATGLMTDDGTISRD